MDALLREAVAEGVAPSVDLVVRVDGEVAHTLRWGLAQRVPIERPLIAGIRWDLASLTKVLAGSAVAYALVDRGRLSFETPARALVPEAADGVTLAQLLSHSAGYPAWRPLYERVDAAGLSWGSDAARALVLREAAATPLEAPPGARHTYSDLGFLVVCAMVEAAGGDRIDRLWRVHVADPGGLYGLSWGSESAVSTELCPRRGHVVTGEVHDLNCASMGGASSHAGLFGDADAVAHAGQVFLDAFGGQGALAGDAIRIAWTRRGAGSHKPGWDGPSPVGSSSGTLFGEDAVGHLGFTGTSLWISPSQRVVVALLTNRVHPSVDEQRIRALRPALHDQVVRTLIGQGRWYAGASTG